MFSEERQLIKEIQSMLLDQYGYSLKQIEYDLTCRNRLRRKADLIVFDHINPQLIGRAIFKNSKLSLPARFQYN